MNQKILCLTDVSFSDYVLGLDSIESNKLFLIDFWAEWCNPCIKMSGIIEDIASEFVNKLTVVKLNVDNNPVITKKYNIRSIPTLLLIRKGVVLSTSIGVVSKQKLKVFIDTYL